MKKVFQNILDDDEHIIEVFKPNKLKFHFPVYIYTSFIFLFMFFSVFYTVFMFDVKWCIPLLIFLGVLAVVFLITTLFLNLAYNKRVYVYSNKRILIQSGLIGTDYKSLDHEMIGATEVRVDFLDKLLNKNTGTIKFGSKASPMNHNMAMFLFSGIKDPYNVYREVKKYIDEVKKANK